MGKAMILRRTAASWGALRVGLGAAALLKPRAATELWVGHVDPETASTVLGRALGGRDVALGAGMVRSAVTSRAITPWIVACGAADAVDAVTTYLSWSSLRGRRGLVGVAATGSALLAAGLAWGAQRAKD